MSDPSQHTGNVSKLQAEIEDRFGVLPNFFRLVPETPEIIENLWGFAKFGYLDNPLPPLFKERLFVYLSRFCDVRYCIARHVGFLVGLGRPSGDRTCSPETAEQVVRLISRPLPTGEALESLIDSLPTEAIPLESFPEAETITEQALFACSSHVFQQSTAASQCLDALRRVLHPASLQHLLVFITFVRTAHFWTKVHPELRHEQDITDLLNVHEALAECVLHDSDSDGSATTQVLLAELAELRRERDQAELLRVTLASIGDAVIATDPQARVTTLNAVAEELTGWSKDSAVGQPLETVFQIVNEQSRQPVENPATKALRDGVIVGLANHTILIAKDGTEHPIDDSAAPIRTSDGQVVGCVLVFRDITDRKQAERKLLESERQSRNILESITDAFVALNRDWRFTYLNPEAERLLGRTVDELLGKNIFEEYPGLGGSEFETTYRRAMDGHDADALTAFYPDHERWYEVRPYSAADGISVYFRDVTERLQAEQDLRESEERYRTLFQSMDEGFCVVEMIFDADSRPVDYRIVEMNPAFERHTGLEGVVGKTVMEFAPNLERHWFETYGRVALTGEPVRFQHLAKPLGNRWFDVYAFRIGSPENRRVAILFNDITGRRRAEAALRESEAHFRSMADNAPTILWVTNPDGVCTYLSQKWYEFTGGSPGDDLGFGWLDRVHRDDIAQTKATFLDANEKQTSFTVDYRLRRKDGEFRWAADTGMPRFDDDGTFEGYVGTVADIHERKLAEESLRTLAAELSEADRRKDEFLATLAHELRNPLAPIRTGLEALKLVGNDPATVNEIRNTMERQTQQLIMLVDDLLDVSRITRGKLELRRCKVEVGEIVKSAVEASKPFIDEAGHTFTVSVADRSLVLEADPHRLSQVLSNLLNNAAKYTPDGGHIQLSVEKDGHDVVLSVKDNGIGIPAEMSDRIFEIFAQIERPMEKGYTGLGIGLTLVKSLTELHQGQVEVLSDGEGHGSEFRVRLPLFGDESDNASREQTSPEQSQQLKRRVLIVDDNQSAAQMLSIVVKILGCDVKTAGDGREAIEVAAEFLPDIVLMDIGMPRMNGYEAAKHIREQPWGKDMLLVALTGWGQDEDKKRTEQAGFDHHLVKPAEPAALQALLANHQ